MKISFLLPVLGLAGGLRVVACFAEELRRRGHDVVAFTPRDRYRSGVRAAARSWAQGKGWRLYTETKEGPHHFEGRPVPVEYIDWRRPFTDADLPDADVLVSTWWETAEQAATISPSKGAKAYFIQQYEANFGQPEARVAETWRLPMQKIVCSRWLADLARDRFGDPTAVVAPNGVDTGMFDAPPRGKQATPTVGLMYSYQEPKCWHVALATLIAARRRLPDLRILAFGPRDPIPSFPLPAGCEFVAQPPQAEIRDLYSRCDAWLCTSSSEGFHLPPHEAMACRCPVVSTRVGGPMDMIEEGVEGYLAEPYDACQLADRLVEVLSMPEDRWRRMSDAAYKRARAETWADVAGRFEQGLALAIERTARGEFGRPAAGAPS